MDEITLSSLPFGKPHVMRSPYYKPFLNELYVGFECELKDAAPPDNDWKEETISKYHRLEDLNKWLDRNEIRVKVLDEKDIAYFGFILNHSVEGNPNKMFYLGKHSLIWNKKGWCILTIRSDERQEDYTAYVGYLRNKSELKRILQMTGCVGG